MAGFPGISFMFIHESAAGGSLCSDKGGDWIVDLPAVVAQPARGLTILGNVADCMFSAG